MPPPPQQRQLPGSNTDVLTAARSSDEVRVREKFSDIYEIIHDQQSWKTNCIPYTRVIDEIWASLRPSTVEKYCNSLRNFCSLSLMIKGEILFPTDSLTAANFLIYLKDQGYSKSSIKLGLVSLKWVNSFFPGNACDLLNDKFLDRIVQSSLKNMVSIKCQKSPISKEMVGKMLKWGPNPTLTKMRDSLMAALSFSLLLRNEELRHLTCYNIIENDSGLIFTIVSSKTDVFRKGKKLFLARQDGKLSVVNLLKLYLVKGNLNFKKNSFLFGHVAESQGSQFIDGSKPLTYNQCRTIMMSEVKETGHESKAFGTHSFRSGGASTLAPKVSPFELMLSGRWADARSLRNYVEVSEERRFDISKSLFV